jgi:hypothetical protein
MPAGDAQRVWFPEMIEKLRSRWHEGMSFEAVIELRDELDAMLQQIRAGRHIRPPLLKCPQCGQVGHAAEPRVSVRAMLFSLQRFGIVEAEHVKTLERGWAIYRRQNRLNLCGKGGEPAAQVRRCIH